MKKARAHHIASGPSHAHPKKSPSRLRFGRIRLNLASSCSFPILQNLLSGSTCYCSHPHTSCISPNCHSNSFLPSLSVSRLVSEPHSLSESRALLLLPPCVFSCFPSLHSLDVRLLSPPSARSGSGHHSPTPSVVCQCLYEQCLLFANLPGTIRKVTYSSPILICSGMDQMTSTDFHPLSAASPLYQISAPQLKPSPVISVSRSVMLLDSWSAEEDTTGRVG